MLLRLISFIIFYNEDNVSKQRTCRFSAKIKIFSNAVLIKEESFIITTPILTTAIIGILLFIVGKITKIRWLSLIAVFLLLIAVWFIIIKYFGVA